MVTQIATRCVKVEGKIASIKELRKIEISNLRERIEALETKIAKLQKKPLLSLLVHQKKRRLHRLQEKLKQLIKEQEEDTVPLCFGSKKLFHAQFNLEANGFETHEEWLECWRPMAGKSSKILNRHLLFLSIRYYLNFYKVPDSVGQRVGARWQARVARFSIDICYSCQFGIT